MSPSKLPNVITIPDLVWLSTPLPVLLVYSAFSPLMGSIVKIITTLTLDMPQSCHNFVYKTLVQSWISLNLLFSVKFSLKWPICSSVLPNALCLCQQYWFNLFDILAFDFTIDNNSSSRLLIFFLIIQICSFFHFLW